MEIGVGMGGYIEGFDTVYEKKDQRVAEGKAKSAVTQFS